MRDQLELYPDIPAPTFRVTARVRSVNRSTEYMPAQQRDDVLAALAARRSEAVRLGIETARALCRLYAEGVTAADVLRALTERHPDAVAGLDARFMGAVMLPSNGFVWTGEMRASGSKARKQQVWRVAE